MKKKTLPNENYLLNEEKKTLLSLNFLKKLDFHRAHYF